MRSLAAIVLATSLVSTQVYADTASLAPGKPAGVQQATLAAPGVVIIFGLAIIAGGIALVTSQGSSGGTVAATTTATAP
jgi:hypothetical protein